MSNLTSVTLTSGVPTAGTGTVSTLDAVLAVLPQAASGTDASSTITSGGTAQNLFSGATPANGFLVFNSDATEDLWISMSTTALANGTGSIRLAANGGGYETPLAMRPFHAVSIVGTTTGHEFTAISW